MNMQSHSLASGIATHRFLPYAALLAAILTFCLGTSFAKSLFPLVGAAGTTAYRVGFAAVILLAVMRPWRTPLDRHGLSRIVPYGMALGTMNLCFYLSLRTTPLGLAIAIEFLGPLTVSLLYSRRPIQFGMIGLALAGLLLLLPLRPTDHALDPTGILFALAAAVCCVLGKRTSHLPSGQTVSLGMVSAAIVVVPIGIHQTGAALLTPGWIVMGLAAALLSSAIPYSLEMVALKFIPANSLGVLLSIEPAVGAIIGAIVLGELLTGLQWLAVTLVVGASIGMVLTSKTVGTP
ncbi:DMT family transporter [Sphingomonas sp. GM_Shp_2]|uniref:EamA family transporter n=1 Tax=Sphingomonas sp. GM_Shp_2 TaxID=2937380 RepID=UPI002269D540|nr:DMT family transporter [Sphingomonas sp. GM_Shp_2]